MDDETALRVASFMIGLLKIQLAVVMLLDEFGVLPKSRVLDTFRPIVYQSDPDAASTEAMRLFVDALEGKRDPRGVKDPAWLTGIIHGGKKDA